MSDWRSLKWNSGRLISTYALDRQGVNADGREGFLPLEGAHIAPIALYFRNTQTSGIGTKYDAISTAGSTADTSVTTTTASGTEIQATKTAGGSVVEFISGRTPTGGATFTHAVIHFWAKQSADTVNAGLRFRLYKRSTGGTETELTGSPFDKTVELTTIDTRYELACDFTDVALAEDERIVIKPYIVNVGTMGAGTATLNFNGATGGENTTTFYTASNPRFEAARALATGWAATRALTSADSVSSPTQDTVLQGDVQGGVDYNITRVGYVFDTSSIPDGATITSAVFSVSSTTTGATNETTNPANGALVSYSPASDLSPVVGDFPNFGTTRLADTDVTLATFIGSSGYKSWTLNATGLAAINKAGNTRLGLRPSNDLSDATAPTNQSYGMGNYTPQTGTADDPKLVITYSEGAPSHINVYPAVTFKAESTASTLTVTGSGTFNAQGAALTTGILSTAGAAGGTLQGASTHTTTFNAGGVASETLQGAALANSVLSVVSSSSETLLGKAVADAILTSAGVGAASFVDASSTISTFSITNTGTFTGEGKADVTGVLSVAGASTASWLAVSSSSDLALAGIATVQFVGASLYSGVLQIAGASVALWENVTINSTWIPAAPESGNWTESVNEVGVWAEVSSSSGSWESELVNTAAWDIASAISTDWVEEDKENAA